MICFSLCDSNKSLHTSSFLKSPQHYSTTCSSWLSSSHIILFINSYLFVKSTSLYFNFSTTHRTLEWFNSAEKSRPYEVPPFRIDRVEDLVEPIWVHGVGPGTMDCGSNLEFSRFIFNFWMFDLFILSCSVSYCIELCGKLPFMFFSIDTIYFFVCMRRNSFHIFDWILNIYLKEFPRHLYAFKSHFIWFNLFII